MSLDRGLYFGRRPFCLELSNPLAWNLDPAYCLELSTSLALVLGSDIAGLDVLLLLASLLLGFYDAGLFMTMPPDIVAPCAQPPSPPSPSESGIDCMFVCDNCKLHVSVPPSLHVSVPPSSLA